MCELQTMLLSPGTFSSYEWNTGSSDSTYEANGEGRFWVTVSDQELCPATDSVYIEVVVCSVFIPNVFTPNGDGLNELFKVDGEFLQAVHCRVFNRWGQLVSIFNTPEDGWDGFNAEGNEAPAGVYYYDATWTDAFGKQGKKSGYVQLLR